MQKFLLLALTLQPLGLLYAAEGKSPAPAAAEGKSPAAAAAKGATKTKKKDELDSETRQTLKLLSEKYKHLQNWEANFTEERTSEALGTGSFNDGKFVFSAPNRFLYSLNGAEASDFLSNGKSAWHIRYKDGRAKPAFVRHFPSLKDVELNSYLFILRGIGEFTPEREKELTRDFVIHGKVADKEIRIVLEPKKSSELARVTLVFKQNEDVISKAVLESTLGNETIIVLKNYKVLKNADASRFVPNYPKGSKVETL